MKVCPKCGERHMQVFFETVGTISTNCCTSLNDVVAIHGKITDIAYKIKKVKCAICHTVFQIDEAKDTVICFHCGAEVLQYYNYNGKRICSRCYSKYSKYTVDTPIQSVLQEQINF